MSFYTYEIHGNKYEFESKYYEREDVAEDCAEDYFDNHDGWEAIWPLEITLYNLDETRIIGKFRVELEQRPHFSATKINEETKDQK